MGIGPTQPAWKAGILPLNYTRESHNAKRLYQIQVHMSNIFRLFFEHFLFFRGFPFAASTLPALSDIHERSYRFLLFDHQIAITFLRRITSHAPGIDHQDPLFFMHIGHMCVSV